MTVLMVAGRDDTCWLEDEMIRWDGTGKYPQVGSGASVQV